MSEYDRIDFEMQEEDEDDYDGPDAYVDEEDVLDLEDLLQDSEQERTGVAQEPPMLRQIFLCEFTRCRACFAHAPLTCSVI
jgi:hypothetical protein